VNRYKHQPADTVGVLCVKGKYLLSHKKGPGYFPGPISVDYSSIASVGQLSVQAPQSMQVSASIMYLSSPSLIAPTGHVSTHAPQEIQASVILKAIILPPLCL
jgi:hypothetical protein